MAFVQCPFQLSCIGQGTSVFVSLAGCLFGFSEAGFHCVA